MKRGPRRQRLLSLLGLALGIVAWWSAMAAAPGASAPRWADDAAWTR